ncbi:DUF3068 domain-containing protein [Actinocorallia sp. API 0066]|uniref:DUF3068 domain-containing protein n=1 Tax=Actinocorallia sp. API 0066 TaxID=2896846 RepID=UPI001E2ABB97|nr:DUF3068 domain-containing protein [Actinocorallia sp. API 0066]MCD0449279.1 DUF3068 domain-containing protein [Actinocorallia sp. API 0066]
MRRTVGVVLLTLGFAALFLAPLLRFHVADRLVVAPSGDTIKTTLTAPGSTYIDGKGTVVENASLINTTTFKGSPDDSTADTALWDVFSAVEDTVSTAAVTYTSARIVLDRKTGALKDGGSHEGDTSAVQTGQSPLFPIGKVEKKTYEVYNWNANTSWLAGYQGEETVEGIKTYRFAGKVAPTPVGGKIDVPGSLVGMKVPSVPAQRTYTADITLWIDPRSGATVKTLQQVHVTLRTEDGVDRATALRGDFEHTDAARREAAARANSSASRIQLITVTAPLAALFGGALLVGLGAWATGRDRGTHRADA